MTKPMTVVKSCGPKLVPFFKTCAIFFVLFGDTPADETSQPWFFCLVKCLPIISLILFVLLHGMNLTEYYRYSRRILIGLIFSCLGDICLVWKKSYFEVGIGMFAIAQLMYATAFGWKPFNPYAGTVIAAIGCLIYSYLSPALDGILTYLVGGYIVLIGIMAWRAIARVRFFDEIWKWTKLSGCVGSIAFVISDLTIATDRFVKPVPYAHPLIMVTYYAAQLGIALSCVDSQVDEVLRTTRRDQAQEPRPVNSVSSSRSSTPEGVREPVSQINEHALLNSCRMMASKDLTNGLIHRNSQPVFPQKSAT